MQGRRPDFFRYLRRNLACQSASGVSDAELLERFVRGRDEAAFELLLWRHGPMVLGVCRRVLRHAQEAEDAFQATWLALARKARAIDRGQSLGSWLFKVAYRASLRARAAQLRYLHAQALPLLQQETDDEPDRGLLRLELRHVLDEELSRLPERYRAPLVLCYLQEKTNEEAARLLHWPVGTVKTRLARGRELLSGRLTRRGVALSGAATVLVLGREAAAVSLTPTLASTALRGACALITGSASEVVSVRAIFLMQGVLQAMFLKKVKLVAVATILLAIVGAGGGVLGHRALGGHLAADEASQPGGTAPPVSARRDGEDEWKRVEQSLAQLRAHLARSEVAIDQARAQLKAEEARFEELRRRRSLGSPAKAEPATTGAGPGQQPVAFVFDTPISRAELGEYLVERLGAERLENLINRRIIEHACRQRQVEVSDQEVEDALLAELRALGLNLDQFQGVWLKKYHKSLYEWKQDVIRPRLMMEKLASQRVQVSDQEIHDAYEAHYGERVVCEFTRNEGPQMAEEVLPGGADNSVGSRVGRTESIGHHTLGNKALEWVIFKLHPDESAYLHTSEGQVRVRCIRRLPPEEWIKLEDMRDALTREVRDRKVQAEIPRLLQELRQQARPRILLHN